MAKIVVTGAGGFVGQALCAALREKGIDFLPVVRRENAALSNALVVEDIGVATNWSAFLKDVDVVVHLAARVHVLHDLSSDPISEYRLANVDATLNLARQCVLAGVKRFIFLSSIKVNGEETKERPFVASDTPVPLDPYGVSKLEAEQGLRELALQSGLELVIIRPPLVYGPNVKANFLQLMRWINRGVPLPLSRVNNRRDMVYVGNLVDLIIRCAFSDAAVSHTFLVSDGQSISTAELIQAVAFAMHRKPRIFPVPLSALAIMAKLVRKDEVARRILGSLQIDICHTMNTLDWVPPYSFEYGIEQTVKHFLTTEP